MKLIFLLCLVIFSSAIQAAKKTANYTEAPEYAQVSKKFEAGMAATRSDLLGVFAGTCYWAQSVLNEGRLGLVNTPNNAPGAWLVGIEDGEGLKVNLVADVFKQPPVSYYLNLNNLDASWSGISFILEHIPSAVFKDGSWLAPIYKSGDVLGAVQEFRVASDGHTLISRVRSTEKVSSLHNIGDIEAVCYWFKKLR